MGTMMVGPRPRSLGVATDERPDPSVVAVGAAGVGAVPSRHWRLRCGRRPAQPDLALVLELLARELRSGSTLPTALASIDADVDPTLALLRARVGAGASLDDALDRWAAGLPPEEGPLVRAVLGLGLSTGAALADALDRAAAVVRERHELAAELRSLTAQSRASAALVAVAPIGFLAAFSLADSSGLVVVATTPLGWLCLGAGAALDGLGFWWMRRLVDGAAP